MHRELLRRAQLAFAVCCLLLLGPSLLAASGREESRLDAGWRFHLGDAPGLERPEVDDLRWPPVRLPHDWSIAGPVDASAPAGGHGGYFPTGVGWYRLEFATDRSWVGRRVEIEFEGAAMGARVWLNGVDLGAWAYGYTPFRFDLTPHLVPSGMNVLAVRVDNSAQPNSRWYSGSGLYRPVWLRVTDAVRFPPGGVWVETTKLGNNEAELSLRLEVLNGSKLGGAYTIEAEFRSPTGQLVARPQVKLDAEAGALREVAIPLTVRRPHPWSVESPELYRVRVRLFAGARLLDEQTTQFGIRTIQVDAEQGFRLNGRSIELFGGNVHHDTGPLGAAAFRRAEERKVELLKAAGFNAVRTAHNPPSTAFLEACDRLGLLVVNEIFDGWAKAKNKQDYSVHFNEWWQRDVDAWVRRDRHHPSVVMWSTGNEMFERGSESGRKIVRSLVDRIRRLDTTRPVTAGVNGLGTPEKWPQLDALFEPLDVAGYNYELQHHAADHERVPKRVMMASESYQNEAFAVWAAATGHRYIIGDFVWSALDYLGEAGIGRVFPPGQEAKKHWEAEMFPWHGAYCGDIDLIGTRKPVSHYRQIVWDRGERLYAAVRVPAPGTGEWNTTPWSVAPLRASWSWPGHEGQPLELEVYSRHEAVRVELNGAVVGEKPTGRAEEFKALFTIPYAPGELKVVGLRGGRSAEEFKLRSAGEADRLAVSVDRRRLTADGEDLAFVSIEAQDSQGVWQPTTEARISVSVAGAGTLAGVGSGDLTSLDSYAGPERDLHDGRALAIVRAAGKPGPISVQVSAPGFKPVTILLKSIRP